MRLSGFNLIFVSLILLSRSEIIQFPEVLTATYTTTAYQIPKVFNNKAIKWQESQYPSREKEYTLYYDRRNRASRIEYTNENGVHMTSIRNYAEVFIWSNLLKLQHYEVRIESFNGEDLCEYSYLGESFPEPDFPETIQFVVCAYRFEQTNCL